MPAMRISSVGYGAGDRDFKKHPNLLRVVIGEQSQAREATRIFVIEANVDDMNPQLAGYVRERLQDTGALDVTLAPVYMKKDRPGLMISVLAKPEDREKLSELLFTETTTLGIRMYPVERRVLERRWQPVENKLRRGQNQSGFRKRNGPQLCTRI